MQSIYNAITGSKNDAKTDSPTKSKGKTPEEIKKMEEEALTSKSAVLKSTEDTEALKQIVKEAERLSIEEKPQFKPASKIASDEAEKSVDKKPEEKPDQSIQVDGQSKKRSFEEISNNEVNQKMTDETKGLVSDSQPKDLEKKSESPSSDKFKSCDAGDKTEKVNEKISPNSKRLKLDDTPPKVDKLVSATNAEKKDEGDKKEVEEELKKEEVPKDLSKISKEVKDSSDVAKISSKDPKDTGIIAADTENQFKPDSTVAALVESKIVSVEMPIDDSKAKQLSEMTGATETEKVEDPKNVKEGDHPESEKPSSIEQAYMNEVSKVSTDKKEETPQQKTADS